MNGEDSFFSGYLSIQDSGGLTLHGLLLPRESSMVSASIQPRRRSGGEGLKTEAPEKRQGQSSIKSRRLRQGLNPVFPGQWNRTVMNSSPWTSYSR